MELFKETFEKQNTVFDFSYLLNTKHAENALRDSIGTTLGPFSHLFIAVLPFNL